MTPLFRSRGIWIFSSNDVSFIMLINHAGPTLPVFSIPGGSVAWIAYCSFPFIENFPLTAQMFQINPNTLMPTARIQAVTEL